MKPPPFSYERPETLAEAVTLLVEHGEGAKLLAGGQSLMPMLNLRLARPSHLVDLNFVDELAGTSLAPDGDVLVVGAMTRQRDLERDTTAAAVCPLVVEALGHVGHFQTRNRGTVGGSLAHLDPAAELVCVATALDATVVLNGSRGERRVPFSDFAHGPLMTDLAEDEVLTSVELPVARQHSAHAFHEFARRHGDFALGAAAVVLDTTVDDPGTASAVRIALIGAGGVPVRARITEEALRGRDLDELGRDDAPLHPDEDALTRADDYQRHLLSHLVRQAVGTAARRLLGTARKVTP